MAATTGLRARVELVVSSFTNRRTLASGAEAADIRPCNEAAPVANQNHRLDEGSALAVVRQSIIPSDTPGPEGVDGWVVDDNQANVAVFFEADNGGV